jgi:hypothetical protein
LASAVVVGSLSLGLTSGGHSARFPFRSVTPAELAGDQISLRAATPPATLTVTAAQAAVSAREFQGGRGILEVHYARCVDRDTGFRHDCWAVAIDPRGLAGHGAPRTLTPHAKVHLQPFHFDVVFVDATTGKPIEAVAGS